MKVVGSYFLYMVCMYCFVSAQSQKDDINSVYQSVQKIPNQQIVVERPEQMAFSNNWKNEEIPQLQRVVVNKQLDNLQKGHIDPVFNSLIAALKTIPMQQFSLLDVACATGYYYEVLKNLEPRMNSYEGADYSVAMIEEAKKHYSDQSFSVQDATQLTFKDNSFDIVMLAGVIEHIPSYEKALEEAARVARHYVIIHRCPLVMGENNLYTIGAQYNIKTPRTFFSQAILEKIMDKNHCFLVSQRNVYPNRSDVAILIFEKQV